MKTTICLKVLFSDLDIDCDTVFPRYLLDILLLKAIQYPNSVCVATELYIRKQDKFFIDFLVTRYPDYISYPHPTNKIDYWILSNMQKWDISYDLPMAPMGYITTDGNHHYY